MTYLIADISQNFGILNMVYELNGRKIIDIFRNAITLKTILRNEIPGNNGLFKVKYDYQIKKKAQFQKLV